jgi:hypothetical protein
MDNRNKQTDKVIIAGLMLWAFTGILLLTLTLTQL